MLSFSLPLSLPSLAWCPGAPEAVKVTDSCLAPGQAPSPHTSQSWHCYKHSSHITTSSAIRRIAWKHCNLLELLCPLCQLVGSHSDTPGSLLTRTIIYFQFQQNNFAACSGSAAKREAIERSSSYLGAAQSTNSTGEIGTDNVRGLS